MKPFFHWSQKMLWFIHQISQITFIRLRNTMSNMTFSKTFQPFCLFWFALSRAGEWQWRAVIFWFWGWQKCCQLINFLGLISLFKKVWCIIKCIFCDQWKNAFILKSFEKFSSKWSKIYSRAKGTISYLISLHIQESRKFF